MEYSVNRFMRLSKEDILNIDRYLIKKGIKYMDIRYELMDHLVSEYESIENYPDLESFLRKRTAWCRKISKEKEKAVHWGGQKALLKKILSFCRSPIFYGILLIWAISLFFLNAEFGTYVVSKSLLYSLIIVVAIQILDFGYQRYQFPKQGNLLSTVNLFSIYSLPNIFLYMVFSFESELKTNVVFSVVYFSIGILVNIAALLEVRSRRKRGLKEHDFLKSSLT